MNLELTEEQKLLQRSVRDFAEAEVKPLAKELDETGRFPHRNLRKAAELGLTGISVPEKYGGAGMDHICYSIVMEEIARVLRVNERDPFGAELAVLRDRSTVSARRSRSRNSWCRLREARKSAATR